MAAARSSAALKLDWAKIVSSLGLKGQTATSLSAFKKRNDDARRKIIQLENQPQSVDFASYRGTLNHTAIVDEIETAVKDFKAKKYDLGRQLKAIEAFEAQALKSAEETKAKVDVQLEELEKCLKDIRETRPLDELTTEDVCRAEPRINEYTAKMVYRGQWMPPGYLERFGNLAIL